jgi:hypothetical protein
MIPTKTLRQWIRYCLDNHKNFSTFKLVCLDELKKEIISRIEEETPYRPVLDSDVMKGQRMELVDLYNSL